MKYLPNVLTIGRIAVTPLLLVLLMADTLWGTVWALVLFVAASISDYLDGKLARSYQAGSRLGQFLDPLADKVLVLGTFGMLAYLFPHIVPWWGVAVIAVRDLFVTGLRIWTESRGRTLRTLPAAKAKTTVQLTFLILTLTVLVAVRLPDPLGTLGSFFLEGPILYGLMLVVVVITAITGLAYLRMEYHEPTHPPLDG